MGVFQPNVFQPGVFQEDISGTGAVAFGFSESLSGAESISGVVGVDYLYDDVTGELLLDDVTGEPLTSEDPNTGAQTWTFASAAAGAEAITGTAAVAFGMSEAAQGAESIAGTATLAFGFSESLSGSESVTGTASLAFTFSEAASGDVAGEPTGTVSLGFGFSLASVGDAGAPDITGHAAKGPRFLRRIERAEPVFVQAISGQAEAAFGFSVNASGTSNDDDLALLLAA